MVFPSQASAIRPLVERMLIAIGVGELPRKLETVSGAFGRNLTRSSDAIWIISAGVIANEIADGTLVKLPFDTGITVGPVGLMTRPDGHTTPAEQLFRLALSSVVARLDL